ncbi:MAG: heme exporter protein CcmD [Halieaceae bacterium]|jgi:heme exporter protein D|nr:heme exporter protein CcmD [Halieaceae bacterium]
MYFQSFADLLAMDGHGPYVWSAYLLTALVLVQLFVWPWLLRRRLLRELRLELRRSERSEGDAAAVELS